MTSKRNVAVIMPAAGKSSRFGDSQIKKVYKLLNGRAVWLHSVDKFTMMERVGQILIVIDPEDQEMFKDKFSAAIAMLDIQVVLGGNERYQSVQNALEKLRPNIEYVAVHDAARPCFTTSLFQSVLAKAEETQAAIPALPIHGTIKRTTTDDFIAETIPRSDLWVAQTPQIFSTELLKKAYAARGNLQPTDDSQLVEAIGHRVAVVMGHPANIKITTQQDLVLAEQAIKIKPKTVFDFG